jgi:hypothetical protein
MPFLNQIKNQKKEEQSTAFSQILKFNIFLSIFFSKENRLISHGNFFVVQ